MWYGYIVIIVIVLIYFYGPFLIKKESFYISPPMYGTAGSAGTNVGWQRDTKYY